MIKILTDHIAALVGLLGAIGALLAWRKKIWHGLKKGYRFFTAPARMEKLMADMISAASGRDEKLDRLCKAMFNGGRDGLVNQVALLAACHKVTFEAAAYPCFQCDGKGANRGVNEAYRILVGATHGDALAGTKWIHYLHGALAEDYREEFERCRLAKEDFIGEVDLRNPITGEHRGRWRVHAPCSLVGDDCVFVGRFIAALDDTARELAIEHGWNVRMG